MKEIFIGIAFIFLTAIFSAPAIAHQLERAGEAAVTIHITPDDTPRVGEESVISVEVQAKDGQEFPAAECDCWLFIKPVQDSQYDVGRAFTLRDIFNPVPYIFSQPGQYDLRVSGIPHEYVDNPSFASFEADFTVDVLKQRSSFSRLIPMVSLLVVFLAGSVWTGYLIKRSFKKQ